MRQYSAGRQKNDEFLGVCASVCVCVCLDKSASMCVYVRVGANS